eukprot:365277-Chlamydomonas_euryale.AAC.19
MTYATSRSERGLSSTFSARKTLAVATSCKSGARQRRSVMPGASRRRPIEVLTLTSPPSPIPSAKTP